MSDLDKEPGVMALSVRRDGPWEPRTVVVPLEDIEWRDSGDPDRKDETTLRGHAAVFNSLSEDLGGFRELIEPGFFRGALRSKPDVRLLVNHDGLPLARTASGTLELREDNRGLHVFARLDKNDPDVISLRGKMKRGDVDQMSFAFSLREGGDDWAITDDGDVVRTLRADGADGLYDVSVVTYPAYRHTEVSMRSVLQDAISRGRLPQLTVERAIELASDEAEFGVDPTTAPDVDSSGTRSAPGRSGDSPDGTTDVAQETEGEERDAAPDEPVEGHLVDVEQAEDLTADWRAELREASTEARESYLRLLKEHDLA